MLMLVDATIELVGEILEDLLTTVCSSSSDNQCSEDEDCYSPAVYKQILFRIELKTSERFRGLLRCVANDKKLQREIRQILKTEDLRKLNSLDDENYHDVLNTLSQPYSLLYPTLKHLVCDQISSQVLLVQEKLRHFIQTNNTDNDQLQVALDNLNQLISLSSEEREEKFEENNYCTTSWLESVLCLLKSVMMEGAVEDSSDDSIVSDDEAEEEGNLMINEDLSPQPSTSAQSPPVFKITIAKFAVDPDLVSATTSSSPPTITISDDDDDHSGDNNVRSSPRIESGNKEDLDGLDFKIESAVSITEPSFIEDDTEVQNLHVDGSDLHETIDLKTDVLESHLQPETIDLVEDEVQAASSIHDPKLDPLSKGGYASFKPAAPSVKVNVRPDMKGQNLMVKRTNCPIDQNCPAYRQVPIKTFDDVLTLARHCNDYHFDEKMYKKQFKTISAVFHGKDTMVEALLKKSHHDLACPIPACVQFQDSRSFRSDSHFPSEHRLESMLVELFLFRDNKSELKKKVMSVLPPRVKSFIRKCQEGYNMIKLQEDESAGIRELNNKRVMDEMVRNSPEVEIINIGDDLKTQKFETMYKHGLLCVNNENSEEDMSYISMDTIHKFIISAVSKSMSLQEAQNDLKILSKGVTRVGKVQLKFTALVNMKIFGDLWEVYDSLVRLREWLNGNFKTAEPEDVRKFISTDEGLSSDGDDQRRKKFLYYVDMLQGNKEEKFGQMLKVGVINWNIGRISLDATCVTCYSTSDIRSAEEVLSHVNQSQIRVHGIWCRDCNEIFTVDKGSTKNAVHLTQKNHIQHVFQSKKKDTDRTGSAVCDVQKIISCDVCSVVALDMNKHASDLEHLENVKLLGVWIRYCELVNIDPVGCVTLKDLVFFIQTMKNFFPASSARCSAMSRILRDYIENIISLPIRTHSKKNKYKYRKIKIKSTFNINNFLPFVGKPSKHTIICYHCRRILSRRVDLNYHLRKTKEKERIHPGDVKNFQCLKCLEFFNTKTITHHSSSCTFLNPGSQFEDISISDYPLDKQLKQELTTEIFGKDFLNSSSRESTPTRDKIKKVKGKLKISSKSRTNLIVKINFPGKSTSEKAVEERRAKQKIQKKKLEEYYHSRLAAMSEMQRSSDSTNQRGQSLSLTNQRAGSSRLTNQAGPSHMNRELQNERPKRNRRISGSYNEDEDKDPICSEDYDEDPDDPDYAEDIADHDDSANNDELYSLTMQNEILGDITSSRKQKRNEEVDIENDVDEVTMQTMNLEDIESNRKTDNTDEVKNDEEAEFVNTESFSSFNELFGISPVKEESGDDEMVSILEPEVLLDQPSCSGVKRKIQDDRDEDCEADTLQEYYYFCLDCEGHSSRRKHLSINNCGHLTHSRVPIGLDIARHYADTGHENLQPIRDFLLPIKQKRMLRIRNVSYDKKWGARVRKCWKKLVLSGGQIFSKKIQI